MTYKTILPKLFTLLCVILLMQSCVSNKAFQTARTTPKGEFGGGLGMTIQGGDVYFEEDESISAGGFTLEAFARVGLSDKADMGLNISLIGTSGADVKFQIAGDATSKFAASIGGGFGVLAFDIDDGTGGVTDLYVPAYLSLYPNEAIGVYFSPRYTLRVFNDNRENYLGGILGFRVGVEKAAFFMEFGTLVSGSDTSISSRQVNLGFGYNIR